MTGMLGSRCREDDFDEMDRGIKRIKICQDLSTDLPTDLPEKLSDQDIQYEGFNSVLKMLHFEAKRRRKTPEIIDLT